MKNEQLNVSWMTALLHCFFAQHMPKYQYMKAKQKLHKVVTKLEIFFASVVDVDIAVP